MSSTTHFISESHLFGVLDFQIGKMVLVKVTPDRRASVTLTKSSIVHSGGLRTLSTTTNLFFERGVLDKVLDLEDFDRRVYSFKMYQQVNGELEAKFKTKADLYEYCHDRCKYQDFVKGDTVVRLHLPCKKLCTLYFLQQIMSGEKKAYQSRHVVNSNAPNYRYEFVVKNVYHLVQDNHELCQYLPTDEMDEGRFPDRQFFWQVVQTCHPNWVSQYYELANRERGKRRRQWHKDKTEVYVTPEWQEMLKQFEFTSKPVSFDKVGPSLIHFVNFLTF